MPVKKVQKMVIKFNLTREGLDYLTSANALEKIYESPASHLAHFMLLPCHILYGLF